MALSQDHGSIHSGWQTLSFKQSLPTGSFELKFDFVSDQARKKVVKSDEDYTFRLTLLLIDKKFYDLNYLTSQSSSLKDCDKCTNFPLTLSRKRELHSTDSDLLYDYPLLRLSHATLSTDFTLHTFYFRLNHTSHFHFALSSHLFYPLLRLTELYDFADSTLGRQSLHTNALDVTLSPGDYVLHIEQPQMLMMNGGGFNKSWDIGCGLFSLEARIIAIKGDDQSEFEMMQCKEVETLPSKVYARESETKGGGEYYVNSHGTFSKIFTELLMKKSAHSMTHPRYDRVEFTPPEDGLLSLILQYSSEGENEIIVKLYDAMGFFYNEFGSPRDTNLPIVNHQSLESSSGLIEQQVTFAVKKDRQYLLMLYYKGEILQTATGKHKCEYYQAMLTYNSNNRLLNELLCIQSTTKSFSRDLPNKVSSEDNLQIDEFFEIRYPFDYGKSDMLIKSITLQHSAQEDNLFDIEASIKFDSPLAMFEIGLFEKQDNTLEDISTQLPLNSENADLYTSTLIRELLVYDVKMKNKKEYVLTISDEVSRPILEFMSKQSKSDLCLYSHIQISFRQQLGQQKNFRNQLLRIHPSFKKGDNPIQISEHKENLDLTMTFSMPYTSKESPLMIQVYETSQQLLSNILPSSMIKSESNKTITLTFDLTQIPLKSYILVPKLIVNNDIQVGSIEMPQFVKKLEKSQRLEINSAQTQKDKLKKATGSNLSKGKTASTSYIQERKQQYQVPISVEREVKQEVKCLCVHGQCKRGEWKCQRCDEGWNGQLCDQKTCSSEIKPSRMFKDFTQIDQEQEPFYDAIADEPPENHHYFITLILVLVLIIGLLAYITGQDFSSILNLNQLPLQQQLRDDDEVELIDIRTKREIIPEDQTIHQLQLFEESATEENHGSNESITKFQPQSLFGSTAEEPIDEEESELLLTQIKF